MLRPAPARAERATWSGLCVAFVYMGFWSGLYLVVPDWLLAPYAAGALDASFPEVERLAIVLLRFVAVYSIFDMVNLICASGLRGAGDTRVPMAANLAGHWLLGLPVGYALALSAGWGVVGLWIGLSVGLISVGIALTAVWAWRTRALVRGLAPDVG